MAGKAVIEVSCYAELNNQVEQEIRRLLRCSEQRTPVCLTAEPYARFRCRVLEMLSSSSSASSTSSEEEVAVYLSQGLVAKAKKQQQAKNVVVCIGWQDLSAA